MATPASSHAEAAGVPDDGSRAHDAAASAYAYAPIPGPVDRESFFDAQVRHRRETWRLTAACGVGAMLTGIPLSLVLTPLLFAVLLVLTRAVDLVLPVPEAVWNAYERGGLFAGEIIDSWDDPATAGVVEGDLSRTPVGVALAAAVIWVIPGILFMLAIWPAVRYLFRHAGTGGVLLSIGARDPDPTDLEERQLVNVIEELAIADGIPAPRVMLIDTDVANAAAVGSSPDDATIVVSRALLDDLDRDETQGVLAHLVASIGNGDLRGALSLLAIFQTFGFAAAIVKAPISGPARATVVRVLRYVLIGRHRSHDAAVEARIVSDLLTGGLADTGDDDYSWMDDPANPPRERSGISFDSLRFAPYIAGVIFVGGLFLEAFEIVPVGTKNVLLVLLLVGVLWVTWHQREYAAWRIRRMAAWARTLIMLPYYIAAMLPQVLLSILTSFILEPLIARLWRARRFLADASAVQLTRNPDGLAGGLRALNARGGAMPGGSWAAPLFIIGGTVVDVDPERMRRHLEDLRQKRAAEGRSGDIASLVVDAQSVAALATAEQATQTKPAGFRGFAGSSSSVTNFHPSLGSRLERLRALGANIEYQAARTMPWRRPQATHALGILFMPVVGVLLLIAAVLMVFVVALLLVMSVTACAFMMAIVYGIMSLVLGL